MTDKEKITNNFVKDINVSHKEQINIDGVDVSSCPACNLNCGIAQCSELFKHFPSSIYCRDNANCYFKQLARKTQECEELRVYNKAQDIRECELKKQNKYLEERLNCTRESLRRVYQREAIYQSTLQNLKNDLTKFCKRIDTTPHSSHQQYVEAYYNENKYKKAIEEMVETLDKFSGMSIYFKFNELRKILNEVIKDDEME